MSVTPQEAAWWRASISTFKHAKSAKPSQRALSWHGLSSSLTAFRSAAESPYLCMTWGCYGSRPPLDPGPCPKCDGETNAKIGTLCWSPASYPEGVNRARARVSEVSCLVLDYDDGTTLRAGHEAWREWPHIMHTSWSHTPEHHKFRVVVPLLAPIQADGWARVFHWARTRQPNIDTQCSDPSRIYFVPSCPAESEPHRWAKAWQAEGRGFLHLKPEDLPKTPEELQREQPRRSVCWQASNDRIRRDLQEQLKTDPTARQSLGLSLGGQLMGSNRIDKLICPACTRPSVYFYIEPTRNPKALCTHEKSCGWHGWLDQLQG